MLEAVVRRSSMPLPNTLRAAPNVIEAVECRSPVPLSLTLCASLLANVGRSVGSLPYKKKKENLAHTALYMCVLGRMDDCT